MGLFENAELIILIQRLALIVLLLIYGINLNRLVKKPGILVLNYLLLFLAFKDLIIFFLFTSMEKDFGIVRVVSEVIILFFYMVWLRVQTKKPVPHIIIIVIDVILLSFFIWYDYSNFPMIPATAGLIKFVFILVIFGFNLVYLGRQLYQISRYNTEEADIVTSTRHVILLFLALVPFFLLFFGYTDLLIRIFLIPLSYILVGYLLFNYAKQKNIEQESAVEALTNERESLFGFMQNLGSAISERIDLDNIFKLIVNSAVQNTGADAGAILMIDEKTNTLQVRVIEGIFPPLYKVADKVKVKTDALVAFFKSTPIKIGETILSECIKTGKPLFIRNTKDDPRMELNSQFDTMYISSFLAVPLIVEKKILGVVSIINRNRTKYFDENDYMHVRTFAEYASININNLLIYIELIEKREIERELGIAAEIQKKLIPSQIPELGHANMAVYSMPAHGVSGDYYDVYKLDKDKVAVIICDVAGKGVPAALVMIMIRSIVRLISSPKRDAATTVKWINLGITGRMDIDHYATLSYLTFDQTKREIQYSNAAHHPLLLYRTQNNKFVNIDTEGLPIGIERSAKYAQKRIPLQKDDIFVLYTDGISEAMNPQGEQYTIKRLQKVILRNIDSDSKNLIKFIREDLDSFVDTRRQFDDQTLIVIKVD